MIVKYLDTVDCQSTTLIISQHLSARTWAHVNTCSPPQCKENALILGQEDPSLFSPHSLT